MEAERRDLEDEEKEDEIKEAKELEMVLTAVSSFIKEIQEPLARLLETLIQPVRGDRLGEEIAELYKKLKESGMPEDLAQKMTLEYFERRTKILESLGNLGQLFSKAQTPWSWMGEKKHQHKGSAGAGEGEREEG